MKVARFSLSLGIFSAVCFSFFGGPRFQASASGYGWPQSWLADSSFFSLWARSDLPVSTGATSRTWLWGPLPFAVANEPYAESPTGKRLVQYFDKGRMEVNDVTADRASRWFVTSGLLVTEMVTGQAQSGNTSFERVPPAEVPVAGDMISQSAPTYATFAKVMGPTPKSSGAITQNVLGRDGSITSLSKNPPVLDPKLFTLTSFDEVTRHNVPAVFADWSAKEGLVVIGGRLLQGPLLDAVYVLGRPITEAYWVDVTVAGKPARVLVQLFERRALTYNPNNAPEWRVEMANVGRAYFDWHYGAKSPDPAVSAEIEQQVVTVRGWNWQRGATVSVDFVLAGDPAPLVALDPVVATDSGTFSVRMPTNPALSGALLTGANVQVRARSPNAGTALPAAVAAFAGTVRLEGVITAISGNGSDRDAVIFSRQGRTAQVKISAASAIYFAEGDRTTPAIPSLGQAVQVDGLNEGNIINVTVLRLLSRSKTGAQAGVTISGGKLRVSGTGWPRERAVGFTIGRLEQPGAVKLPASRIDSRGNLIASANIPNGLPKGPLWIFASVVDKNALLAQVVVPFAATASPTDDRLQPPKLHISAGGGEALAGLGNYCWLSACVESIGIPVPMTAVNMAGGESVGLHGQIGPDPELGTSPTFFSAQLFGYPPSPYDQGTVLDGTYYFRPSTAPLFSTGDLAGKPFSITLPRSLNAGRYILVANVGWPSTVSNREMAQYGLLIQVP